MTIGPKESDAFAREVVDRVLGHMNACHPAENLLLARELGGVPAATAAWAAGFDPHGIDLIAEVDSGPVVLRLAFGPPAPTIDAVRAAMMRLLTTAATAHPAHPAGRRHLH
jgi:putative heme iron utilization protein